MLKLEIIGHIGADVEIKESAGRKWAACRVAHSDVRKDANGVKHETTTWIDVNLSDKSPLLPYLLRGTQVFVRGDLSLRVYSSAKDRCYKAGLTLFATEVQLLSSKSNKNDGKDYQTNGTTIDGQSSNDAPF